MKNWFETHIKYDKTLENGTQKKVDEAYLVDAMTFTEAESRIIEEMTPYIVGDFEVNAAKKANISEIFTDASGKADRWYRAKVMFVTLDEKSGMEKKTPATMLVQAEDFQTAVKNLETGMKGTMSEWEIFAITETKILDVLFLSPDTEEASN